MYVCHALPWNYGTICSAAMPLPYQFPANSQYQLISINLFFSWMESSPWVKISLTTEVSELHKRCIISFELLFHVTTNNHLLIIIFDAPFFKPMKFKLDHAWIRLIINENGKSMRCLALLGEKLILILPGSGGILFEKVDVGRKGNILSKISLPPPSNKVYKIPRSPICQHISPVWMMFYSIILSVSLY
jgi:hypothetical protein